MSFLQWQRRARAISARIDALGFREIVAARAAVSLAVEALIARCHGVDALEAWCEHAIGQQNHSSYDDLVAWLRATLGDRALDDELFALAQRHHSTDAAPFVLEHITHALDPRARVHANLYSTPEPVARWMARCAKATIARIAKDDALCVLDPSSGAGALLLAFARESPSSSASLFAIERDPIARAAGALHTRLSLGASAPRFIEADALSQRWSEHRATIELDERARKTETLVVLANPPFASSEPMNPWLSALVRGEDARSRASYRLRDGDPPLRNTKWLDTAQLRFLRWIHEACDCAPRAAAVVALGHAWVDHPTFAPVRRALCESFDEVSVLDLHGAARHGLHTPDGGRDQNLFEIQQGLCLLVLARSRGERAREPLVRRADLWGTRANKLAALDRDALDWNVVSPSAPAWSFSASVRSDVRVESPHDDEREYRESPSLLDVFEEHGSAIISGRDAAVLGFDRDELERRIELLSRRETARETLESLLGAKAFARIESASLDALIERAKAGSLDVRRWHYRPWDVRFAIDDRSLVDRPRPGPVIDALRTEKTLAIVTRRQCPPERPWNYLLVVKHPPCDGVLRADPHGTEVVFSRERLADGSLAHNFKSSWSTELARRIGASGDALTTGDAFAYVVGVLMDERYRARHRALLSKDVPRLLWPRDADDFAARVADGARWIRAHTEDIAPAEGVSLHGVASGERIERVSYDSAKQRIVLADGASEVFVDGVTDRDLRTHIGARRPALRWLEDRVGQPVSRELEEAYRSVVARVRAHARG